MPKRRNIKCHFSPLPKPRRRGRASKSEDNGELNLELKAKYCPFNGCKVADSKPPASGDEEEGEETQISIKQLNEALESTVESRKTQTGMPEFDGLQELYMDRLLAPKVRQDRANQQNVSLLGLGVFGADHTFTFFSESRLASLSMRLGHSKVNKLLDKVNSIVAERLASIERVPSPPPDRASVLGLERTKIAAYVASYFEQVHPIYPFLERRKFELSAFGSQSEQLLANDKAWSALYYTVLAIGCQYHDEGCFQPGTRLAWRFFSIALALFPDLMIKRGSLTSAQAIAAMAIYAGSVSAMQIEHTMISEGAKKVQSLGYNRSTGGPDDPRNKTFWVMYCLEKTNTFLNGRSSIVMDSDISCAISHSSQPAFTNFDFMFAFIRHSRLLSRIHASLFSVSATGKSIQAYRAILDQLIEEHEAWRQSIPAQMRPSDSLRPNALPGQQLLNICIMISYLYYFSKLALLRTSIVLDMNNRPEGNVSPSSKQSIEETKVALMHTARSILELTRFINVEPYTSMWYVPFISIASNPLMSTLEAFRCTNSF
jgi:hypothetical protein